MAGKNRFLILFFALILAALACAAAASADDAELLKIIPGEWTCSDEVQEDGEEVRTEVLMVPVFREDGTVSLRCLRKSGEYAYTCEGTWTFELVTGGMDRLAIRLTSTDNPAQAEGEYDVGLLYNVYSESWEEDSTLVTYLLLEEYEKNTGSPFEDIFGYDGAALCRRQEPNRKVVNCKKNVTLRQKPSKSSRGLEKVPLGALVLAFPEEGEENGFVRCLYHNTYGYILAAYLAPAD